MKAKTFGVKSGMPTLVALVMLGCFLVILADQTVAQSSNSPFAKHCIDMKYRAGYPGIENSCDEDVWVQWNTDNGHCKDGCFLRVQGNGYVHIAAVEEGGMVRRSCKSKDRNYGSGPFPVAQKKNGKPTGRYYCDDSPGLSKQAVSKSQKYVEYAAKTILAEEERYRWKNEELERQEEAERRRANSSSGFNTLMNSLSNAINQGTMNAYEKLLQQQQATQQQEANRYTGINGEVCDEILYSKLNLSGNPANKEITRKHLQDAGCKPGAGGIIWLAKMNAWGRNSKSVGGTQ